MRRWSSASTSIRAGTSGTHSARRVADATVELLRSANPAGPFMPVPNGSAVMSPSNRTNSDLTDADGHFGWDVVAGYYKVRASKDGCVSNADRSAEFAETHVMTIPPPVTNLDIRLYCGEGGGGNPGGGGPATGGGGSSAPVTPGGGGPKIVLASLGQIKLSGRKVVVPVFWRLGGHGRVQGLDLTPGEGSRKEGGEGGEGQGSSQVDQGGIGDVLRDRPGQRQEGQREAQPQGPHPVQEGQAQGEGLAQGERRLGRSADDRPVDHAQRSEEEVGAGTARAPSPAREWPRVAPRRARHL